MVCLKSLISISLSFTTLWKFLGGYCPFCTKTDFLFSCTTGNFYIQCNSADNSCQLPVKKKFRGGTPYHCNTWSREGVFAVLVSTEDIFHTTKRIAIASDLQGLEIIFTIPPPGWRKRITLYMGEYSWSATHRKYEYTKLLVF